MKDIIGLFGKNKAIKYIVVAFLLALWFLGFICLVNKVFTWYGFVSVVIFWAINVFGWFELIKRYM